MDVVAWDRELSEDEMWTNMENLNSKLGRPPPQPADKASMVAWCQSGDASLAWKSSVGTWQGRVTKGVVTRVEAGFGAAFPVAYLTGDALAGYDFGPIMKRDYTVCSVTRFMPKGAKQRILQSNRPNSYHGHCGGGKGGLELPASSNGVWEWMRPATLGEKWPGCNHQLSL